MRTNPRELRATRDDLIQRVKRQVGSYQSRGLMSMFEIPESDRADLQDDTRKIIELTKEIERLETMDTRHIEQTIAKRRADVVNGGWPGNGMSGILASRRMPAWNTGSQMNEEDRAITEWVRTGQKSELLHGDASEIELRAVTDSTMNITTDADGGYAVPTGLFPRIVARRNEILLARKLGCQPIGGVGTTVNVPIEDADPQVFATTAEQDDAHAQNYERDAARLNVAAMTLVKKTKKLEVTEELFVDEAAGLLPFLTNHIGRGQAVTHNAMLLTEVAANGTSLKTFASATAIAAGEIEDIVYGTTAMSHYLEDEGPSIGFVVRAPTYGDVISITAGADRTYAEVAAAAGQRTLLTYPVHFSDQAAAIAASAKSVYFGNWQYIGLREAPSLQIIRDAVSVDGLVILKYSFRAVYKVLQAAAIGYGVHPSA